MTNLTTTNIDNGGVVYLNPIYNNETLSIPGADTYLEGTILARKSVADAVVAVDDVGNTGDGTVTLATVLAGAIIPEVGAYNLEMIELGTKNGVAVGAAVATATGNGTASAVVAGALAKAGDYIVICVDATVSGSEIFDVTDPDGEALGQLVVGVAYLNEHFGITISDGGTDFIVGDFWTISITDTGGLFKLENPDGLKIAEVIMDAGALAVTVVEAAGLTFTITAGATDFIVGDKAALTVAADGDLVVFAVAGAGGAQVPLAVLTFEVVATGAEDKPIQAMVAGVVRSTRLVIDGTAAGVGITKAILDQLRDYGIASKSATELLSLDNQ